jgi:hypothetical protein
MDPFATFDFDDFWDDCDYAQQNYQEPPPGDAVIAELQAELGYRIPDAYIALARRHNGGLLRRSCHPMDEATSWAEDHVQVCGLYALGRQKPYSLGGEFGSRFMQEQWGYPDIGIVFADCPSAGHDVLMLDYRHCGPQGEPQVVHVDQEADYAITVVAPDFAAFIHGLVDEEAFDDAAETLEIDLVTVDRGTLSPIVRRALDASATVLPHGERHLRALARKITEEKGFFALYADADSHRMYDWMFWLYSQLATTTSFTHFVKLPAEQNDYATPCYELMLPFDLVAAPFGFKTGGFAPGFVEEWWNARVADGAIVPVDGGYRFSAEAEQRLLHTAATEPT